MTERVDYDARQRRIRRRIRQGFGFTAVDDSSPRPVSFQRRRLLASLDKPLVAVVVLLARHRLADGIQFDLGLEQQDLRQRDRFLH